MAGKTLFQSKVLIVDDQPLAQIYMKQSLESIGFRELTCAEHAHSAIRLCEKQKFDLILCSYNLGRDKDGYHLYEELKKKRLVRQSTGFIFISAETDASLVRSVVELQPDDFLAKPFVLRELSTRIERLLKRKRALAKIYDFIDVENYSKALKYIEANLNGQTMTSYSPILLRLKGELLIKLNRFAEAKEFFKSVLNLQKFTWAKVGLVESLIANHEYQLARSLLESMVERPETKLVAFDLLGKLELHLKNYNEAQIYLSSATDMSPRNIVRQNTLVNVARLNHDYEQHYDTNRAILKFAKHSIHDCPDIYLNVARAGVDYALTTEQSELITRLTRQTMEYLSELKQQFPDADTQEQLDIVRARLHYLKDERDKAVALINQLVEDDGPIRSVDDTLDKAKALHELGFHQRASELFEKIAEHCAKYPVKDSTFIAYISQEKQEREDIKHGPRELNNTAVKQYQSGKYQQAVETFSQAFRVMPRNQSIALNLLQCILNASRSGQTFNSELIGRCTKTIENSRLDNDQRVRYDKIKEQLQQIGL
ncbi:response regulator [Pseudoalteromonas tunicata]|uniref:Response regulatory domain-containing protein n=1 Tax=Pseudoalteromonas tunicata D2 TaxID=87626 RepID=A4CFR1_9GAMM|nr:response regulator [Pseudoalteromonas tunicata]ATC94160.1 hypothetical protein PTUN_a1545 [Pseudoalteromonas tunicata]AXT29924.1 response regulator [Pseudoalteromonas tunicata]EAR26488.1 hypothetical protein PTD2_04856 [Pseudoalteromonas tunicata D2]MDP4982590.1 response regulator [Pseudoalteromonas tunicata]MDP5215263.1 response regulator [Pseudoalteromonas tunicata]